MSRQRCLTLVIAILVITNISTGAFLFKTWRINRLWREEMPTWVGTGAALEALSDFRSGKLQNYELTKLDLAQGGSQGEFMGRHDGPFEIWTRAYFPDFSPPDRLAKEYFIEIYNAKMRIMHADPARFGFPVKQNFGDK
jgi:hypothetical protein